MLNLIDINQKYTQGDSIVEVLSNLCLKINGVKNIGIIGPSGSGKSTLLNTTIAMGKKIHQNEASQLTLVC